MSLTNTKALVATALTVAFLTTSCGTETENSSPNTAKKAVNTTTTTAKADKEPTASKTSSEASTKASSKTSVDNCGRTVSLDAPAKKVVTIHPAMTEMVVAAGGKESLIGQMWTKVGYPNGEYQADVKGVKEISDKMASREKIQELKPDLIVASGDFWFDGKRMDKIEDLKKAGIAVFINSSACGDTSKASVNDAFGDLENLGKLLGKSKQAGEVAQKYEKRLEKASGGGTSETKAALVQLYQGDTYAYDGGIYGDILQRAGLSNVFKGALPEGKRFGKVSTEAVISKDPTILLVNYSDSKDKSANVNKAKNSYKGTKAVTDGKVTPVSEIGFVGGIGSVRAVEEIRSAVAKS